MYMQHASRTLTINAMYTKLMNCKKLFMYNHKSVKLLRLFKSLTDSVVAVPEVVDLLAPNKAVMELDERESTVKKKTNPETPVSALTKRKDAVFRANPFHLRDSGCINIKFLCTRGLVSLMLSHANKRPGFRQNLHGNIWLTRGKSRKMC